MPMSSGGRVASSSGCATKPKAREIGWTGYAGLTQHSLRIGHYVMATAEHREPCDSRGSCTVLGAPGGEIPPGDSAFASKSVRPADCLCPHYLPKRTSVQSVGAEGTRRRLRRGSRHLKIRAESHRSARIISDVDPFRDGKGVVDLDTEVPHRTLDLGVAEQELYR